MKEASCQYACSQETQTMKYNLLYPSLFLLFISCFLEQTHAFEATTTKIEGHFHTLHVKSLLPSSFCTPSKDSIKKRPSTVEVFHRHGPCSKLPDTRLTLREILSHDQARVDSINARLNPTKIPVQLGNSLGSGDYVVSVGLGTPKRTLSLILDTGSDLTWTQCQPCTTFCYTQQDPLFNPNSSSSYSNISCSSPTCSHLASATGYSPRCNAGTCMYHIDYTDDSFSLGLFSRDTLALGADVFTNFNFGCGRNNLGLFVRTAGVFALGRDRLSVVSQTESRYGKYFSYCLPSSPSSMGHLTLGKCGVSRDVEFTPFDSSRGATSYYIRIISISVAGVQLPINQLVFETAGTIVDSGTVITRLPMLAYAALRDAFKQYMHKYPTAPAFQIMDTCYDFSGYSKITVPNVSFTFGNDVKLDLSGLGILIAVSSTQTCLAFAGNLDSRDTGIFGNTQQTSFEVVHDVAGGKLGFIAGGC